MNGYCCYRYTMGMQRDLPVKLAPPSSLSSCSFSLSLPALEALVAMTASSIAPSKEETWTLPKPGLLSTTTSDFDSSVLEEAWIKTFSDAAYPDTPKGKSVDVSSCPCSWESLGTLAFPPCFLLGRFLPFTILEQVTCQIGHNQGPQSNSRHTLIT